MQNIINIKLHKVKSFIFKILWCRQILGVAIIFDKEICKQHQQTALKSV